MPEDYFNELDCYADREPEVVEIRQALDEALKPIRRRKDQITYIIDLLYRLMPETDYSVFIDAIKNINES